MASKLLEGVRYEVALEILGQSMQPLLNAIEDEEKKLIPSEEFIRYCNMRIATITHLQDELDPSNKDTIERIFNSPRINELVFC